MSSFSTAGCCEPISLVWKRSFGEPGKAPRPLHLYGYGSYEASMDPAFSAKRLSELDRGVAFAVARHLIDAATRPPTVSSRRAAAPAGCSWALDR